MLDITTIKKAYDSKFHAFDRALMREYLQYQILAILFTHPLGNKLSFLGGTCLRIVYGLPRFSEDIDFDNKNLSEAEFEQLGQFLQKELEKNGYLVEIRFVAKGAFHCYIKFPDLLYQQGLSPQKSEKILIQVDTFDQKVDYKSDIFILDKFDFFNQIKATPKEVILAQKLWTITQRARLKGRDFFDIMFLLQNTTADSTFLQAKFGTNQISQVVTKVLDELSDANYTKIADDVRPFLLQPSDADKIKLFPDFLRQVTLWVQHLTATRKTKVSQGTKLTTILGLDSQNSGTKMGVMIKRKIFAKLKEHLSSDQMTIITGPRQVGKTYLMNELREELDKVGHRTVWLNLDSEEDRSKFTSQANLIAYINLQVGEGPAYVFIDEIQRKNNAGLFLKGIFDMNTPYKFIVSGSGSLELKAKISESMAGRKQLFSVDPISFEEFVNLKTNYQYENRLAEFFDLELNKTNQLLAEYMSFGGYPRVVLATTVELKQRQMQEIYKSYIDQDISGLLAIDKTDRFSDLLKVLASQIGSLVNVNELASTVKVDVKTINQYLSYLEKTFIIKKVTPFFRNKRSEITKAPIYYFVDVGLRNWLLGLFGLSEIPRPLSGHLLENIAFNILREQTALSATQIHFWRTKDQAEVDFVLETGLEVAPVEVKYASLTKLEISRSLRSFLVKYKPHKAYLLHSGNHNSEEKTDNTTIELLPFHQFKFAHPPQLVL